MLTIDLVLEKLDNTLDEVDELVNALPISNEDKKELCSKVYSFWMDVEEKTLDIAV